MFRNVDAGAEHAVLTRQDHALRPVGKRPGIAVEQSLE
jgi:hypothetical protein